MPETSTKMDVRKVSPTTSVVDTHGDMSASKMNAPSAASPSSKPSPPSLPATKSEAIDRRLEGTWAAPVSHLKVGQLPRGAVNLNVEGRQVVGPLQGFGQLWQKTYRVHLRSLSISPVEVIATWKANFPTFQPPENRFYTSVEGIKPGEVVMINAQTPGGLVSTGVLVMYADDESFTLMTPQGHPESGWVTFSAYEQDGYTVAQVQSIGRSNDPLYEMMFLLIGSREQERIWVHVLTSLAAYYGVKARVMFSKSCVDSNVQWNRAGNIWHNAAIRTTMNRILAPVRRLCRGW